MAAKDAVGRYGEQVAARYLVGQGLRLLDRNWRSVRRDARGELDLVAADGSVLVVVEVKTRRGVRHGSALEAVTQQKLSRLRRLAGVWADDHTTVARDLAGGIRIDVVAVQVGRAGAASVLHVRGVS